MKLREVLTTADIHNFHLLPRIIYKNDNNWIEPIHTGVEKIFNPAANPFINTGECRRWLLYSDIGDIIGRIAAFAPHEKSTIEEYRTGRMGFFECTDDTAAAELLFNAAKNFLASKGCAAMEGPVNFGERNNFWGLRIGADSPPSFQENYHPRYYQKFFENYGFRTYFTQHTYNITHQSYIAARLQKIIARVLANPDKTFRHFRKKESEKFISDFREVYNAAWQKFENFKPVSAEDIRKEFKELNPVLVEEFIWFAYVTQQPAGFFVMMPDVNQILKYSNGKLDFIGKLKFLFYRKTKPINKLKILVFGIAPHFQNRGIDAGMVYNFYKEMQKKPQYTSVEISWVGGFNPRMRSFIESIGGIETKLHITFKFMIDKNLGFSEYKLDS